eukprot:923770-Amphidinium_carterae.1
MDWIFNPLAQPQGLGAGGAELSYPSALQTAKNVPTVVFIETVNVLWGWGFRTGTKVCCTCGGGRCGKGSYRMTEDFASVNNLFCAPCPRGVPCFVPTPRKYCLIVFIVTMVLLPRLSNFVDVFWLALRQASLLILPLA